MNKHRIRKIVIAVSFGVLAVFALLRFSLEPADYYDTLQKTVAQAATALEKAEAGNDKGQYSAFVIRGFSEELEEAQTILDSRSLEYEDLKPYCRQLKKDVKTFQKAQNSECLSQEEVAALQQEEKVFERTLSLGEGRQLTWSFNGAGIKTPAPVNLGVTQECLHPRVWELFRQNLGVDGTVLTFLHNGPLPATAAITLEYTASQEEVRIFRYDGETGKLGNLLRGEAAGQTVTFPLQEGGTYFILNCGLSQETPMSPEEALSKAIEQAGIAGGEGQSKAACTIEIRCDTIVDTDKLTNPTVAKYVPADGTILAPTVCEIKEGESVFELLQRVTRNQGIQMEFRDDPLYSGAYIEGINHLYEFDGGPGSGWMYKVNGWFPNYGCSQYKVKDGDAIVWCYTCNIGKDVGDQYYDTHPDANPEYE